MSIACQHIFVDDTIMFAVNAGAAQHAVGELHIPADINQARVMKLMGTQFARLSIAIE